MTQATGNVVFTDMVRAGARKTFDMGDRLSEAKASIMVECVTPGGKVIVERSMYFDGRFSGSDTIGAFSD